MLDRRRKDEFAAEREQDGDLERLDDELELDEAYRANARARGAFAAEAADPSGRARTEAAPTRPGKGNLPAALRAEMERAFGTDFSDVRVHQGGEANELDALAYARGDDLYFSPGAYEPNSAKGRELLGHELAHVVQQREGRVPVTARAHGIAVNEDASLEAEADGLGVRAARGEQLARVPGAAHASAPAVAASTAAQFHGFETLEAAIENLGAASKKHILAAKHAWHLVVGGYRAPAGEKQEDVIPEGSWESVKEILLQVAREGEERKYKSAKQRSLIINDQTVVLTYVQLKDGFRVSDAWVQTK